MSLVVAAVALAFAGLTAFVAVFCLFRGVSYNTWQRAQGYAAHDVFFACWFFMAAATFATTFGQLHRQLRPDWPRTLGLLGIGFWLLYALSNLPFAPTSLRVLLFSATVALGAGVPVAVSELFDRNPARALKQLGIVLAGSAALALTIWLLALHRAREMADILLMVNADRYFSEALDALLPPVAWGAPWGPIVGCLMVWRERRGRRLSTHAGALPRALAPRQHGQGDGAGEPEE